MVGTHVPRCMAGNRMVSSDTFFRQILKWCLTVWGSRGSEESTLNPEIRNGIRE